MNILQESKAGFLLDQQRFFKQETQRSILGLIHSFEDQAGDIVNFCSDSTKSELCEILTLANRYPCDREILKALKRLQKEIQDEIGGQAWEGH